MSIDCLALKTNFVLWRNADITRSCWGKKSPHFSLDGFDFYFKTERYTEKRKLKDICGCDYEVHEYQYSFKLIDVSGKNSSNYVVIPYLEAEGKFVRLGSTIDMRIWKSDITAILKQERDTITMLLHFSLRSITVNPELNIDETPFSIPKDSGKELTRIMCLKGLCEDIGKLFNDVESSDATLKCADKSFSVHRQILSARSEVFSAMFKHDLSEKNTGVVDIVDMDPDILERFLRYLYSGKIAEMSMDAALELYQAAEKYSISTLKELCTSYILVNLSKDNVFDVILLADKAGDVKFMDGIMSFTLKIKGFYESPEWKDFAVKYSNLALNVYFKYRKQMA